MNMLTAPAVNLEVRPWGVHERACAVCAEPFTAKRADARTCSTKCRVAAHRKAKVPAPVRAEAPTGLVRWMTKRDYAKQLPDGRFKLLLPLSHLLIELNYSLRK